MRTGLLALGLVSVLPARAAAALNVVTTTEGLAALAREVGGDRVRVDALSRGIQDPHFVDPNPTLAVKLRNADLLVDMGLELEVGWLPPLVNQSRNPDIQPSGKRRLVASSAVDVLDVPTGPVDRSQGDIHPSGNPHFLSDPRRAERVAAAIAAKLGQLDPGGASYYAARLADFQKRLEAAIGRWRAELAPVRGTKVVTHHNSLTYLLDFAGMSAAGYLEPKPGITPPPAHLADLVGVVRAGNVHAILVENYYDRKAADLVGRLTGARVEVIPGDVGGSREASDYLTYVDVLVKALAQTKG
ncbi:MAG TPA: metal ABC transporter substrate-binding protein [Anaeromyxobacteraceae bacterium]|nr:metal ABC transporter substrate-binding protein [Anaeromyxobacteraceae bacterium]